MASKQKYEIIINYNENMWFAPRNILYSYATVMSQLDYKKIPTEKRNQLDDTYHTALLVLGFRAASNAQFWIQAVRLKEETPDVRTVAYRKQGNFNQLFTQDVQVVTLEEHSEPDIYQFLARTKLNTKKKSYDEKTTVLCVVNRKMLVGSWRKLSSDLSTLGVQNDVYLLGKIRARDRIYKIARINPVFDQSTVYDALIEAKKPQKSVVLFKRGVGTGFKNSSEKNKPFEIVKR